MSQDRLEALLLSAVEKDLLLGLKDANLAATFATKAERRMQTCQHSRFWQNSPAFYAFHRHPARDS